MTQDPLSQILSLLHLDGYMFGGLDMGGDWLVHFPDFGGLRCYALVSGTCWLAVDGLDEPLQLSAGDCFLLPRGGGFYIGSDLSLPARGFLELASRPLNGGLLTYQGGGDCLGLGGYFDLQGPQVALLLGMLPRFVHLRSQDAKADIRWLLERISQELRTPQPGGDLVARQLAQLLLIQVLRAQMQDTEQASGWLSALADPELSLALSALHAQPTQPWTVAELARVAGMSRTRFAVRFKAVVGLAPLQYLTRWRMLLAAERLQTSRDSLARIAHALGYASESAFSLAFKREMGLSPRQYGRRHQRPTQPPQLAAWPEAALP